MKRVLCVALLVGFSPAARGSEGAEARLAAAWRLFHPGAADPVCPHPDSAVELSGEFGREGAGQTQTALASLRYGVVLFSAAGRPLGWSELGCGDWPRLADGDYSRVTALEAVRATRPDAWDLVVRTHRIGHSGTVDDWELLQLRGTQLERLLAIETAVDFCCDARSPIESIARVEVLAPGRLRVTRDPRHQVTIYQIVGGRFVALPEPQGGAGGINDSVTGPDTPSPTKD